MVMSQALITPEVVQLPAMYKSSNGTVFPHICALASKVWSPEYIAGTHACDIWHVHRTAEPIVYGHSAFVQGLCFHPTKPSWYAHKRTYQNEGFHGHFFVADPLNI